LRSTRKKYVKKIYKDWNWLNIFRGLPIVLWNWKTVINIHVIFSRNK
jgi:hypothetical protein